MTTPVLYVGGFGRSGSTLLELILGSLPGACTVGELVHVWERGLLEDQRCGCGAAFSRCWFWTAVGTAAFGGWDQVDVPRVLALKASVDRNRYVPRLLVPRLRAGTATSVREYTGYYRRIYQAVLEVSRCEVVVDSSKHVSLLSCLRWDPELAIRVVHVVRDSRGVAYSWGKTVRRPEVVDRVEYMPRYSPAQSALLWSAHNAMFEALRIKGGAQLRVRYEDFVANPRAVVERVGHFGGLPLPGGAGVLADHRAQLTPTHTVAGNPLRFAVGEVEVRADEAWRQRMPARDRRIVSTLTSPLRAVYGY